MALSQADSSSYDRSGSRNSSSVSASLGSPANCENGAVDRKPDAPTRLGTEETRPEARGLSSMLLRAKQLTVAGCTWMTSSLRVSCHLDGMLAQHDRHTSAHNMEQTGPASNGPDPSHRLRHPHTGPRRECLRILWNYATLSKDVIRSDASRSMSGSGRRLRGRRRQRAHLENKSRRCVLDLAASISRCISS
jgi:hypothetical protein